MHASDVFHKPLHRILSSVAACGIYEALAYYDSSYTWPELDELNRHPLLSSLQLSGAGVPIRFAKSPSTRARGFNTLYQPRIFLKGEVSTRTDNWHDFFNAMVWLSFPKIKAYINRRHFFIYDSEADFPWTKNNPTRNREQDALTIFDEGGAVVVVSASIHIDTYKNLNADERKKWLHEHINTDVKVFIFGHAVYEVLLEGHKDILASGIFLVGEPGFFYEKAARQLEMVDRAACDWLEKRLDCLHTKEFTSVPVNLLFDTPL